MTIQLDSVIKTLEISFAQIEQDYEQGISENIIMMFDKLFESNLFDEGILTANLHGLTSGHWDDLGNIISKGNVFSEQGYSIIIAPYHVPRPSNLEKLSLVLCKEKKMAVFPWNKIALESEGLSSKPLKIKVVDVIYSRGNICGTEGETFIVPTAWKTMSNAKDGVVLFDINRSQTNLEQMAGNKFLKAIFDPKTAEVLIDFRDNRENILKARLWEYSLHEYGHIIGDFSERVEYTNSDVLQAALEEFRCDGVMVDLVDKHIKWGNIEKENGREILMSNFLTRFGMDIVRNSAELDQDVLASYYIANSMLQTKKMLVSNGKFVLEGNIEGYDYWNSLYSDLLNKGLELTGKINNVNPLIDEPEYENSLPFDLFTSNIKNAISKTDKKYKL